MNRIIPALPPLSHGCVGHEARNSSFVVSGSHRASGDFLEIPPESPEASGIVAVRLIPPVKPRTHSGIRSLCDMFCDSVTRVRGQAPDHRRHPMRVRGRAATARRSCHSPSSLSPFRLRVSSDAEEAADVSRYRCLASRDCPIVTGSARPHAGMPIGFPYNASYEGDAVRSGLR